MICIPQDIINQILQHTQKEFPNEACGILSGKHRQVKRIYPMVNTQKSPTRFLMDPQEQLKVMKQIRKEEEEMIGIYHSHLASEAYPSRHDVELAFYPDVSYVIVSLKDKDNPRIRSFRIIDGKISEEELKII